MREFKDGDRVECILYGKGVVFCVDIEDRFSIFVRFDCGSHCSYTNKGCIRASSKRTLFHLEDFPEIIYKPVKVKVTKYKVLCKCPAEGVLEISSLYYESKECYGPEALQILESTAKEFWEEEQWVENFIKW